MKNQLFTFAFLAIIGSMIIGGLPNYVFADSQSDSMISIAMKARDQLRIQLSKSTNASDDLEKLLEKGSTEIRSLMKEAEEGNVQLAREHFLNAMKIFREIGQKLTDQQTQAATTAQTSRSSSNELERLELYIDRLEGIALKTNVDVEFSKINGLVKDAKAAQREGNYQQSQTLIQEIKRGIIELQNSIKEKTSSTTQERAKSFAQKHLDELDRLIIQAKNIGVSDDTIKRLEEARGQLNEASEVQQIIAEVKNLISIKQNFEETKELRIKSRINQLESTIERLSKNSDVSSTELEKAKGMISEIKNLIGQRNLPEAIDMINSLNSMLNEIQTSPSTQPEASTAQTRESENSLDASKTDRIKIKIERLENQIDKLQEQIGDNYAAKRWLENAEVNLGNAKSHVDDSPDEVLEIIMKVEQIIKRVMNTIR